MTNFRLGKNYPLHCSLVKSAGFAAKHIFALALVFSSVKWGQHYSLGFLICIQGSTNSPLRHLRPFSPEVMFGQAACCWLLDGRDRGGISFSGVAWGQGFQSEWEPGKSTPGSTIVLLPLGVRWTMDSVSFPSNAFAYFTVLTSWLRDLVKLHTTSDCFWLWVWTLEPTWWFLGARPNSCHWKRYLNFTLLRYLGFFPNRWAKKSRCLWTIWTWYLISEGGGVLYILMKFCIFSQGPING